MDDGIPGWLQHCHKVYCEKGGCYGRQALIVGMECTTEMYFPDEWTCYMTSVYLNSNLSMTKFFQQILIIFSLAKSK